MPDNQVVLTEHGRAQSLAAGQALRQLIGDESVLFFVSPFQRSRETFELLLRGGKWDKMSIRHKEDPRIREQEWYSMFICVFLLILCWFFVRNRGNFLDPSLQAQSQKDRERVGKFFYRFPNGESGADVYDRVCVFLDCLFKV